MARIRTIKPEFWDDEKVTRVSLQARLTFVGMWNQSDDYAVVKGHPLWLKNKIFPYDDIKLAQFGEWLAELERQRFIIPFDANGEKYYYIRNFNKHQNIDRPSKTTRNPAAPEDIETSTPNLFDESSTSPRAALAVVREGKVREGKVREYTGAFLEFYEAYPNKQNKAEAFIAWKKIDPQNGLRKTILSAIQNQSRYKKHLKDAGESCPEWPHPSTWLNKRRWEDEIPEVEQSKWFSQDS